MNMITNRGKSWLQQETASFPAKLASQCPAWGGGRGHSGESGDELNQDEVDWDEFNGDELNWDEVDWEKFNGDKLNWEFCPFKWNIPAKPADKDICDDMINELFYDITTIGSGEVWPLHWHGLDENVSFNENYDEVWFDQ